MELDGYRSFAAILPSASACGAQGGALRVENGNGEMKLRALAHFALDPDAAAMNFDEMFGDGQAQAGAADFAGTGNVNSVETLENARLIGPGDAYAGVGDGEGHFGAVHRRADHDLAAGRSVLHGVVEQIL